jgi:hypothetical protein
VTGTTREADVIVAGPAGRGRGRVAEAPDGCLFSGRRAGQSLKGSL